MDYTFEQFCEEIPDREKSWLDRDNLLTEVYIDDPDILRKSMICHYSGIKHRPDMAEPVWYENGISKGWFFPF